MYSFSNTSLKKLSECHKDLQRVAQLAIKISEVDFGISCGYRSPEKQAELYAQGRTKPGKIVTYVNGTTSKSKHNYKPARAFDVYAWVNGKVTWEVDYYHKIAEAVKLAADTFNIQVQWGGDWGNFKDYPHFQLV